MKLYLGLGTNIGDRKANIEKALELLNEKLETKYDSLSSFIETKSWGFSGADFLNCAVRFDTNIEPKKVLNICKSIEKQMGRDSQPQYDESGKRIYENRIIDIDILIYGDIKLQTEELTIPHPLINERDFVKIPLKEIFD